MCVALFSFRFWLVSLVRAYFISYGNANDRKWNLVMRKSVPKRIRRSNATCGPIMNETMIWSSRRSMRWSIHTCLYHPLYRHNSLWKYWNFFVNCMALLMLTTIPKIFIFDRLQRGNKMKWKYFCIACTNTSSQWFLLALRTLGIYSSRLITRSPW